MVRLSDLDVNMVSICCVMCASSALMFGAAQDVSNNIRRLPVGNLLNKVELTRFVLLMQPFHLFGALVFDVYRL